jgi:hypothetical protein
MNNDDINATMLWMLAPSSSSAIERPRREAGADIALTDICVIESLEMDSQLIAEEDEPEDGTAADAMHSSRPELTLDRRVALVPGDVSCTLCCQAAALLSRLLYLRHRRGPLPLTALTCFPRRGAGTLVLLTTWARHVAVLGSNRLLRGVYVGPSVFDGMSVVCTTRRCSPSQP